MQDRIRVEVVAEAERLSQTVEARVAQVKNARNVSVIGGPPRRRDRKHQICHECDHRENDQGGDVVVVHPPLVDPEQEADGQRQWEVQEVEDNGERGQVVGARRRPGVEEALQPGGRQATQADDPLDRDHVGDMDRLTELVGVATHQLVCEEQRDERDPVAQEEASPAKEQRGQPKCHHHQVGRDGDPLCDHQDREKNCVRRYGGQQESVVAAAQMSVRLRAGAVARIRPRGIGRRGGFGLSSRQGKSAAGRGFVSHAVSPRSMRLGSLRRTAP